MTAKGVGRVERYNGRGIIVKVLQYSYVSYVKPCKSPRDSIKQKQIWLKKQFSWLSESENKPGIYPWCLARQPTILGVLCDATTSPWNGLRLFKFEPASWQFLTYVFGMLNAVDFPEILTVSKEENATMPRMQRVLTTTACYTALLPGLLCLFC